MGRAVRNGQVRVEVWVDTELFLRWRGLSSHSMSERVRAWMASQVETAGRNGKIASMLVLPPNATSTTGDVPSVRLVPDESDPLGWTS